MNKKILAIKWICVYKERTKTEMRVHVYDWKYYNMFDSIIGRE